MDRDDVASSEEMEADRVAAAAVNEIVASCQAENELALTALEGAVSTLKSLTFPDVSELKSLVKPPDTVRLVVEAVCIMLTVKPWKIKDPDGGTKKIDDYWGPAKNCVLNDQNLLTKLINYDKDNIPPAMIEKITTEYTSNELFDPDLVKKDSLAAAGLCKWVHAMIADNKFT